MTTSTLPRSLRRSGLALLLAALVLLLLPSPRAKALSDPVIVDWHYSTTAVSVSGLASVPVVVTVHITSPPEFGLFDGLQAWSQSSNRYARNPIGVGLHLVSGGVGDGVYEGTYEFTAAYAGTFTVTQVAAPGDWGAAGMSYPAPAGIPLVVTTSHVPRVTVGAAPSPVALTTPFVVKGRVYDSQTQRGLAGVSVSLWTVCGESCPLTSTRTNALGYYAFPYRTTYGRIVVDPHRMYVIVSVYGAVQSDHRRNSIATAWLPFVPIKVTPRASVVKAWVPRGSTVTVVGSVGGWPFRYGPYSGPDYPQPSCQVALERRTATTSWVKVATSRVRESARFTLSVRASTRGAYLFRVYVARCASVVPARSHVVHVVVG
jgi:hypothetical protein